MASEFHYVHSCDLDSHVCIKVCTMEGNLPKLNFEDLLDDPLLQFSGRKQSKVPDLLVEAVILQEATNKKLHLPVSTAFKSFTKRWEWNEWLKLPIRYSDLPRDAVLALSVFDCVGGLPKRLANTSIKLFGKKGIFREGQLDLTMTPEHQPDVDDAAEETGPKKVADDVNQLAKLTKKYRSGKIPPVDWLDRLTFAEVERISQKKKQSSNLLFLMVEFTQVHYDGVNHSIVYFERNGDQFNSIASKSDILRIADPEIQQENLVETKHHRLVRSKRTGQSEKELKPNATIRNKLNEILVYPTTQVLSSEEKDLIWQYRFYLSANKKALAKFVKCVNWNVASEALQALELVHKWTPMDVEDALELLGPSFRHPGVRRYAVSRLRSSLDADLQLYLLQLVQALKYEKFNPRRESDLLAEAAEEAMMTQQHQQQQRQQLHSIATIAINDENNKAEDDVNSSSQGSLPPATMTVSKESNNGLGLEAAVVGSTSSGGDGDSEEGGLAQFLIDRACRNSVIANYFYWYLVIECEDFEDSATVLVRPDSARVHDMYLTVLRRFKTALRSGPPEWKDRSAFLERQHLFVDQLVNVVKTVARESGNRKKKIERLQTLLSESNEASEDKDRFNFVRFKALQLPLDPDVKICGVVPSQTSLFKSSLMPARLTFITDKAESYVTIFKHGDDLRQDQLILQIITLMDGILQQENLDLKLTPYRVLATSSKHGFVQFVNSAPIADILNSEGSIQNFFKKYNPSDTGPYGISPDVMDTYVKSCAGYCVITYLLGVGDRHLDNLLLTQNGKLFHIDFGYILGRDPKPLPPPMKLSKEMIEAFGGMTSEHYQEFRKECYTAFLSLRRHANVILNLFSLMVDASVPDIALEPDKTVKKVQDKFRLDLSDEEAVHYMQSLIDVSATAVMAAIVERIHKLAQFWRN